MATNKSSPYLQIRHNLSRFLLADWKWLHPILITFKTLCLVELCMQWYRALRRTRWRSYLKNICSCLVSEFSGKATTGDSPPKFQKLMSQLWRIHQPQYFITFLLDLHWTYFWKHYMNYKPDTKVGSQNLATKFGFVSDCLSEIRTFSIQRNAFENVGCEMVANLSQTQCVDIMIMT